MKYSYAPLHKCWSHDYKIFTRLVYNNSSKQKINTENNLEML